MTQNFHLKRTLGNKVLKEKNEQLNVSYVLLRHWESNSFWVVIMITASVTL